MTVKQQSALANALDDAADPDWFLDLFGQALDSTGDSRDTMYMTWIDVRGKPRLVFSRSTDRGDTWSAPLRIGGEVADTTWQIQPSIAVNTTGKLARPHA